MNKPEHFKNIIIGGGIAGFNIAHQLKNVKNDADFVLLQDTLDIDSRVHTYKDSKNTFELGASIFNITHDVLFDLIKCYDLTDKISDVTHYNRTYYHLDGYDNLTQEQIKEKHDSIDDQLKDKSNNQMTLHQLLLNNIIDQSDRDLYISTTPGYFEGKDRVSKTYFDEGEIVDDEKNKTYSMKGGLSQLLKAIYDNVKDHVVFGNKVIKIVNNETSNRETFDYETAKYEIIVRDISRNQTVKYTTNKIYLCVSKTALIRINCVGIDFMPLMKLVKRVSSFREYITFKESTKEWFGEYEYVLTNLHFHWMIRMGDKTVMIYTDGDLANYLHNMDKDKRLDIYLKNFSRIFDRDFSLNDVDRVIDRYWSEAFSVVRKKYLSEYDNIINNLKNKSIVQTVVPKNKGFSEGWMESSLIRI